MFAKLFAESGLSLDRLRALLEVGLAGSIVKAAEGDPIKQSQYSRQIKELEDFFQIKLLERHGKGIRLTANGKALARIARFFLLGLSNFQRGCLTEEQSFRIGGSATFIETFLLPVLADPQAMSTGPRYAVEIAADDEIEKRLHDLTMDFGIVTTSTMSRPLQLKKLGAWRLNLWVPRTLYDDQRQAVQALKEKSLPLALAAHELPTIGGLRDQTPRLLCSSFLEARTALKAQTLATLLPDFMPAAEEPAHFTCIKAEGISSIIFHYHLAWNPRLLRLNPRAARRRDFLFEALAKQMTARSASPAIRRTVRT